MRFLFTFFICCLFITQGTGQICTGNITLSTQAEVDTFDCAEVAGSITIEGGDITNLDGMSDLESVGESIVISSNSSLTIISLPNLESVNNALIIIDNEAIASINFPKLETVGTRAFFNFGSKMMH